jgi:hypothetical protein
MPWERIVRAACQSVAAVALPDVGGVGERAVVAGNGGEEERQSASKRAQSKIA